MTAGLYTGQDGPKRTRVTQDGLITDRYLMRRSAPDILLTNYKMLDQMLLRRAGRKDLGSRAPPHCTTSSSTSSTPTTAPRAPTSPCCCDVSG